MAMSEKASQGWKEIDWVDLEPIPGSFISSEWKDYTIFGETVNALNYVHAEYLWLTRKIEASGGQRGICQRCNHHIRYAVVFEDEDGEVYHVGEDCAQFISSQLNRDAWAEKKLLSEIKTVKTKNGERKVLSFKVPQWYWNIEKAQRPSFCSVSKYTKPGRYGSEVWYLSIWGATVDEVYSNWETLQAVRKAAKVAA